MIVYEKHPSTVVLNASEGSLPPFPALDPYFLVQEDIIVTHFSDIVDELVAIEHPMLTSVVCLMSSLRWNVPPHTIYFVMA